MSISSDLYEFIVKVIEDKVKDIKVTREEFDRLSREVSRLSEKITELAEAQRRTEEQVGQLAEAQRRTEERLNELARRVDQLAEAQRRTEEQVRQLAEAQRRTEEEVRKLSEAVRELRKEVGRLSAVIGFGLEDIARVMVPGWLERHMGVYVEELRPSFIVVDGEEVQINLFGVGRRGDREVIVVGECKSRIYSSEVRSFARTLEKVRRAYRGREIVSFLFGFLVHPSAQKDADKLGIKLIATYMR